MMRDETDTPEKLREQASRCLRLAQMLVPGTPFRHSLETLALSLLDEAQAHDGMRGTQH
jgi:hypothetical protein